MENNGRSRRIRKARIQETEVRRQNKSLRIVEGWKREEDRRQKTPVEYDGNRTPRGR